MDNEEFEHQLRLEAKEKALKEKNEKDNPNLRRDPDGTLFEWDAEKKAWFPKIDDTFLAFYQHYNYQYVEPEIKKNEIKHKKEDNSLKDNDSGKSNSIDEQPSTSDKSDNETNNQSNKKSNKQLNKQPPTKQPPSWFNINEEQNTNVYVSNLPDEITDEEFFELMQKCGLILKDVEANKFKIKLYKDKDGKLKGDGLCTYIKQESVILALQILDGYQLKGKEISVERAKFQLKGEFDPAKKPRKRKLEDKKKHKKRITRLLGWQEKPNERPKFEKVVIIKNFFSPTEFDKDPTLISDLRQDIEEECSAKCGPVKKVQIYDRNQEGVVAVFFQEFEHADQCVNLMNGRFFAGRQLSAENWDGRTKYKIKETEEEAERRIEEWTKYLDDEDADDDE